jgi:alkanesulfonate monooxygenase SsuD/methylene tetrahydromethanopterin reductase-like flavin-dependent oxidoreductase (luciferase family)
MKFGIYLPKFGPFGKARLLAEIAGGAERANWVGCFIGNHLVRSIVAPVVDPWIALSAIAMKTERIKIGALVTPLARRRPLKLTRETVSLDHLSNGRLVFGMGLGGQRSICGMGKLWGSCRFGYTRAKDGRSPGYITGLMERQTLLLKRRAL